MAHGDVAQHRANTKPACLWLCPPPNFHQVFPRSYTHTHRFYFLNRNVFRRWEGGGSNREDSNVVELLHMYLMAYPAPLL